jgi:alkaline phosphatase
MIEGSQIDWACHNNDKIYLAHEMIAFEKIVREVRDLAIKDPTLQVLITADHETGGLSINSYEFSTEIPKENDSLAILIEKRSNRTNEVDVSWSSMGHTNKKVILSGVGAFTEPILNASHLTDIFSMVYNGINYNISIKQTANFDDSQRKFVLKRTFYFRRASFEDLRKRVFYGFDRKRFFIFLYINIWGLDIPYKMIEKKYLIFDL